MRILIADDEAYLRTELQEALERVRPGENNIYYFADEYETAIKLVSENAIDVAFLDIQMPGKSGLVLAQNIKKYNPNINIVIVTAYSQYALDALKLFVSGYLLKPVMDEDLREVLNHLRNPIRTVQKTLEVWCFGNFEVFADGKPIAFKRQKEKELLAYLVCLKGASASRGEICANIFEGIEDGEKAFSYLKTVTTALKKDLRRYGFEDVLVHNSNSYSVDINLLKCDYYDYLNGKADSARNYQGEFMNQYSWAEKYIYELENY